MKNVSIIVNSVSIVNIVWYLNKKSLYLVKKKKNRGEFMLFNSILSVKINFSINFLIDVVLTNSLICVTARGIARAVNCNFSVSQYLSRIVSISRFQCVRGCCPVVSLKNRGHHFTNFAVISVSSYSLCRRSRLFQIQDTSTCLDGDSQMEINSRV